MAEFHINIDELTDHFHKNDHRFDEMLREAKFQLKNGNSVVVDKQTAGIMPNVVKRLDKINEFEEWVKFNYPAEKED